MTNDSKDVAQATKLSVQERGDQAPGLFWALVSTGGTLPAWWSKTRDRELRAFWKGVDHLSSAFYTIAARLSSVPFKIEPRDPEIKGHWKQAEKFESILAEESEFGQGWEAFWTKWLTDLWAQDNGAFGEVIGEGRPDGPIRGPAVGLAHLDSYRCQRTGDPEFPVIYSSHGKPYKLHHSRVIFGSQLPSPNADMNGVGLCWASRCAGMAQHLKDIVTYIQEKLGSRPYRGIIYGGGVHGDLVGEAAAAASEAADNANLARFSKWPVLMSAQGDISLNMLDLSSLPDGFDLETSMTLGIYTIAEAGGFPPRWIWPATVTGATKADAAYQHMVGNMAGAGATLRMMQLFLAGTERGRRHTAGKFLPPHLKLTFDFQDDEQDRARAEIGNDRSERHERDLASGVVDLRTAREQMLSDGDLTTSQFERLELEGGRTPEGDDLLDLFYRGLELLEGIDPRNPDLALAEERLVEAKRQVVEATAQQAKKDAQMAEAALKWLLGQSEEVEEPEESLEHQLVRLGKISPVRPEPEEGKEVKKTEEEVKERILLKQRMDLERELEIATQSVLDQFGEEAVEDMQEERQPDYAKLTLLLLAVLIPLLTKGATEAATERAEEIGIGFDPGEINAMASDWARRYGYELVTGITDTTRKVLQGAMSQYVATPGMTTAQLTEMIAPAFGEARAQMIAVTETTRAWSAGTAQYRNLLQEQYEVKTKEIWYTLLDERVCFPAGTMITTRDGQVPIEDITAGDVVKTQGGWNKIVGTNKRDYNEGFTAFSAGGNLVVCTVNHPIWEIEKGWLDAGDLEAGYSVQLANDEAAEVVGVFNFTLPEADNFPSVFAKIRSLTAVAVRVLMPILAIHLKGDLRRRQKKVHAVAPNLPLLDKIDIEGNEHLPDVGLKQRFALESAVASKRAKLPVGISGHDTNPFAAIPAVNVARRAAALFGAMLSSVPFLARERFPARLAYNIFGARCPAFPATHSIAVGVGAGDAESFATDRADLLNSIGGGAASVAAKPLASVKAAFSAPSRFIAMLTDEIRSGLGCLMVAFRRTKETLAVFLLGLSKGHLAMSADINERHGTQLLTLLRLLYHGMSGKAKVYNLQVAEDPTFYANMVLVHNCAICGPLHGTPDSEWGGDFPDGPPAHPNCRCRTDLEVVEA